MANTDVKEIEQIEKSLKFGDAKLKEIRNRKRELTLLEQDILATREKLIKRFKEIKAATNPNNKEGEI